MKAIADFVIAFLDLLEAEGRTLKKAVMRVGTSILMLLVALMFLLAAVGFFLVGMYQYLISQFPSSPVAALALAGLSLLMALVITGIAHWRTR
jgi:hypothetical protein